MSPPFEGKRNMHSWRTRLLSLPLTLVLAATCVAQKSPLPDESQQEAASKLVGSIFKRNYDAAKTLAQKRELAQKIREAGQQSPDDPVSAYASFKIAQRIYSDTGDVDHACQVAEDMAQRFDTDGDLLMVSAIEMTAPHVKTAEDFYFLDRWTRRLIPELIKTSQLKHARSVAKLAEETARKARETDAANDWSQQRTELAELEAALPTLTEALKTLEKTPADAVANGTAGKITCFLFEDWPRGISMLALGDDADLQRLAERELRSDQDSKERLAIADAWQAMIKKQTGVASKNVARHALMLYQEELPTLTGLARTRVQSQTEQLSAAVLPDHLPLANVKITEFIIFGDPLLYEALVGDRRFPDSFWAHPPKSSGASVITIELPCEFKTLTGACAIGSSRDEVIAPRSAQVFRMSGNQAEIWRIKAPLQKTGVLIPFRIDIRGQRRLQLIVDCPGEHHHAWATWVTPMLHK
jgi:hypothetical protein